MSPVTLSIDEFEKHPRTWMRRVDKVLIKDVGINKVIEICSRMDKICEEHSLNCEYSRKHNGWIISR